jgi:hypothetical protein
MSDSTDLAKEGIEQAHHHESFHNDHFARRVAILVSATAAFLAIAEMGEKSAQNDYLTNHVTLSDDWAFYQAKTVRWTTALDTIETLQSLPNVADPGVQERIRKLQAEAARLNDDEKTLGRKQLEARAVHQGEERAHAFHRYHLFEYVVGVLQIAIVLASVSVVTRTLPMAIFAGVISGAAALAGIAVATGLF